MQIKLGSVSLMYVMKTKNVLQERKNVVKIMTTSGKLSLLERLVLCFEQMV